MCAGVSTRATGRISGSLRIRASSWLLHRSGIFQDSQNDLRFPDLGLAGRCLVLSLSPRHRGSAGTARLVGASRRGGGGGGRRGEAGRGGRGCFCWA